MAILGKDTFGRINPGIIKPIKQEEENDTEGESIDIPMEPANEEIPRMQSPGASLEYLDRMREIKNREKPAIGNPLQSEAKLFDKRE